MPKILTDFGVLSLLRYNDDDTRYVPENYLAQTDRYLVSAWLLKARQ